MLKFPSRSAIPAFSLLAALACTTLASAQGPAKIELPKSPIKDWPAEIQAVQYLSTADDTMQPTLFYKPAADKPVPLLVALHTWGGTYLQAEPAYAKWCISKGWAFVHPDFRGGNSRPEACGSELVVQDILSVVEYARKNANIDANRIYLVGVSGGGYATMLMAGRAPEVWAGVSAWCGISDLKAWHAQCNKKPTSGYSRNLEKVCGGAPGTSAAVDEEYHKRSAITWLENAKNVPVDLNTGIMDGHRGSVPTSQSLNAFNVIAAPEDDLATADIDFITQKSKIPAALKQDINDPLYKRGKALFRKTSGNTRITVFNGGHSIIHEAALTWLERQRKGQPAVWDIKPNTAVNLNDTPTEAGK